MKHLFKKGDVVNIFQMLGSRRLVHEGQATVLKPTGDVGDEYYLVRFHAKDGKPALGEEYERFIDRDGQGNPDQYIRDFNKRIGYAA